MDDTNINIVQNINLSPVIVAVIKEILKPVNEWTLEIAKDGRLTEEDIDSLHRKLLDASEVIGPAVEERLKGVEWITAEAESTRRLRVIPNWRTGPPPESNP